MRYLSKFAKDQFQPMFDNLKPDFHGSDSFQFISKTPKGTRHDDIQIQIDIKQPEYTCVMENQYAIVVDVQNLTALGRNIRYSKFQENS